MNPIGLLQTDEPITRTIILGDRIEMRINVSDILQFSLNFAISLAWYHNGSQLTSDGRVSIGNRGTSLTISNMVQSDAGKYEVKISSTNLDNSGGLCDRNILPMLENLAIHAPVTFLLQDSNLPAYNPEDIIIDYTLPPSVNSEVIPEYVTKVFSISNTFMVNVPAVMNVAGIYNNIFREGFGIFNDTAVNSTWSYGEITEQYLMISYNNNDDIVGHYLQQPYSSYENLNESTCPIYYTHFQINFRIFPLFSLYLNITSYSKLYS